MVSITSKQNRGYDREQIEAALLQPPPSVLIHQVATDMYESLDTPFSLSCALLLKYGEYAQLVGKRRSPFSFTAEKDLIAESLLRKYEGFEHVDLDPTATALRSFADAEERCRITNTRLRDALKSDPDCVGETFDLLDALRTEIEYILGPFDATEWLAGMSFGPGKGLGTDAKHVAPFYKMSCRPTYSGPDPELALAVVKHCSGWANIGLPMKVVAGSKHMLVNKDASTKRSILVEPIVNLFSQKGIGKMMRNRLRRHGVDLNNGQLSQRVKACSASITGLVCTVDLKSASDMIARLLVELVIDKRWFYAMNAFRSPCYKPMGSSEYKTLEKFSSMGNGYTFELESLLFFALARVICKRDGGDLSLVGVYGDDIIIPTKVFPGFKRALGILGMEVNDRKTHVDGYFRESCGGNYYGGTEQIDLYIKEPLTCSRSTFLLANRLHARAISAPSAAAKRCFECGRDRVIAAIPRPARELKYPDVLGESDIGLAVPDLEYQDWDRDLQTRFTERWAYISRPIESRMDKIRPAIAHMLYEVEGNNKPWSLSHQKTRKANAPGPGAVQHAELLYYARRLSGKLHYSEDRRDKIRQFHEFSMVPHRGRLEPVLKRVRYYAGA